MFETLCARLVQRAAYFQRSLDAFSHTGNTDDARGRIRSAKSPSRCDSRQEMQETFFNFRVSSSRINPVRRGSVEGAGRSIGRRCNVVRLHRHSPLPLSSRHLLFPVSRVCRQLFSFPKINTPRATVALYRVREIAGIGVPSQSRERNNESRRNNRPGMDRILYRLTLSTSDSAIDRPSCHTKNESDVTATPRGPPPSFLLSSLSAVPVH